MKKTYLTGIVTLVVMVALGAMAYLCCHTDMHTLSSEVQPLTTQLQEGTTAEVTLLNAIVQLLSIL